MENRMIDKNFCMSSYLAFRYIERDGVDFYPGLQHHNIPPVPEEQTIKVKTYKDIDLEIKKQFDSIKGKKLGIMLSGGMDSANLASYMRGCDAYTFRFLGGKFGLEELQRAEYYANYYGLKLHYVDINWDIVQKYLPACLKAKNAPVHSIEPQILAGAMQAKTDGVEVMIIGESSDLLFGGMDQLLSQDWMFDDFVQRYTFTDPSEILVNPVDMNYLYEQFRQGDRIDFMRFMDYVYSTESASSYYNAFAVADMQYYDPYAKLRMAEPIDLHRVRNGEPKYLIRDLFHSKYPNIPIPNKVPMPRPVDFYFKDWQGPTRPEFRQDINLSKYTGNQKWQMYCLEQFLDMHEPIQK